MDLIKEDIAVDNSKGKDNQKMDLIKEDITVDGRKEKDSQKMDLIWKKILHLIVAKETSFAF
jgi:hypothetical protein